MSLTTDNGEFNDVLEDGYITGTVTVGTSEVEARVGGSPLSGRELLIVYNKSNKDIFHGPSGVTTSTGVIISKGQTAAIPVGAGVSVYLIAASAGNDVVVQELG